MQGRTTPTVRRISSTGIEQWQFEEGLNGLRRTTPEAQIRRLWETTGQTAIDAVARSHVAEWRALDCPEAGDDTPATVVEAMVRRAFVETPWQLYVVEDPDGAVRGLRTRRGLRVDWVEGRCLPPPDTTVAMRVARLDAPDVCAATLPVEFGGRVDQRAVVASLLRAYGDSKCRNWPEFMGGPGGRIVLEHGLEHLRRRAERGKPERAG